MRMPYMGAKCRDRWQAVPARQPYDHPLMGKRQPGACHNHSVVRQACYCCDGALDRIGVAYVDRTQLHPERWCHGLDRAELASTRGAGWVTEHRYATDARRDLFEQLQPFSTQAVFEIGEPGDIAARPREALHETGTDRVHLIDEHDRHA